MYCVVKVENWKGETIKGATNLPSDFENGEQLNKVIEIENEFRLISQEFMFFLSKCQENNNEKYCNVTLEIALDEEVLIPETTVKVPIIASGELKKLLCHIKEVCIDQVREFLMEEREVKEMKRVSYELPAFFNGDINLTLFH